MNVGIIGRSELLFATIEAVARARYPIAYIITAPEESYYTKTAKDFQKLAGKLRVPFLSVNNLDSPQAQKLMKARRADVALSVNWKTKIRKTTVTGFPHGIVNAHAGDLPRYRGNATVAWAILSGEKKIVLTLHLMDEGIDEGPVFLKKSFPINDQTYIGDIYTKLQTVIPESYLEVLDGLRKGSIRPVTQSTDPKLAIRCYPRQPQDGRIDWNSSALFVSRLIRASAEPFSGAHTYLSGKKMIIWRGREEPSPTPFLGVSGQIAEIREKTGEVAVLAKDNFIILEQVQLAGRKRQKPAECIRSARLRL